MFNIALIRCPVGFSEEIMAIFQIKKPQIDTENEINLKSFHFLQFFVKFLTDFVDSNALRGQRGKGWLSSSLLLGVNCNVRNQNVSNRHRKRQ